MYRTRLSRSRPTSACANAGPHVGDQDVRGEQINGQRFLPGDLESLRPGPRLVASGPSTITACGTLRRVMVEQPLGLCHLPSAPDRVEARPLHHRHHSRHTQVLYASRSSTLRPHARDYLAQTQFAVTNWRQLNSSSPKREPVPSVPPNLAVRRSGTKPLKLRQRTAERRRLPPSYSLVAQY